MQPTLSEYTAITSRIEKLEKQNQRFRLSILFLLCSLSVLVLMGAKSGLHDGRFRQITAEKISFVDSAGKELMVIGIQEDKATGIRIFNKKGSRVLGMGITADERGSGLLVADNDGNPRFGLGMDMAVPSLAIIDENGKKTIALGGDKRGYGLVIMDENEVERAGVGYKDGNTGIVIYDNEGQYVRGMVQHVDGGHFSSYIDNDGKEIYAE